MRRGVGCGVLIEEMRIRESESDGSALEGMVLQFVRQPGYRPRKPRQIARELDIPKEQAADVRRAVKRLVRQGLLIYEAKHMVRAAEPAARVEEPRGKAIELSPRDESGGQRPGKAKKKKGDGDRRVSGVFRRAQGGFGFVRPVVVEGAAEPVDIYIPRREVGDASDGDTVLVRLTRAAADRKAAGPQGEIVEVLERETHNFVGSYFEADGGGYVTVDGTIFAQPIFVGDASAKRVQPDDKVVIEMLRFPSPTRPGEGVVTEVLGPRGQPGVDTLSILREFQLPEHFPEDVLAEARAEALAFDDARQLPEGRRDLTAVATLTIDPVDARDFDDAISLERFESGHWRLGVHIADVSAFVRPGSALDREARQRATSTYLPDRVIPMLPETLSNGVASLQPSKVRYTKTAFIEYTPEGVVADVELCNSAIRSAKRLTYEEVDEFLVQPEAGQKKLGAAVSGLLERMRDLARLLRQRRRRRGALELTLREVKVELNSDGEVSGARVVENTESHQMIEEFMLAANEAVAEKLRDATFPFLRRVHLPPSERKIRALQEFASEMGLPAVGLESRFALQDLLDHVAGRPEQYAVNFAVLRSLQRAVYSPANEGHFALASDCYCHFTSPIRRYPDLTIHRLFDALLAKQRPTHRNDELLVLGQHCSDQEQKAEMAERELTKLKLLGYLSQRIGLQLEGVVTGVESYGLFVQGIDLPAEGLLPVAGLPDDQYRFDRTTHSLCGFKAGNAFRLGDALKVSVAAVDMERRQMELRLVSRRRSEGEAKPAVRKHKRPVAAPRKGRSPAKGRRKK